MTHHPVQPYTLKSPRAADLPNGGDERLLRSYEYDEAGRLVRFVDRDGNAVEYGHDARGNTISESWYDASGTLTRTIAYAFDRYDRLAAVDDAGTDYAYAYDHLGRLRSETVTRDGSVTVLHYDYDRRGQVSRVSAVVDGRADFVTEYRYDLSGRLREIAQHGVEGGNPVLAKRATIDYDRFAGTMTIRRYEGDSLVVETVQQYAEMGMGDGLRYLGIASITHLGSNGQPLVGHEYAYDDSGLVESYENSVDGTSEYSYDATGQLISADHETQSDESYQYDANGNRIDYAVGPANQILCDGLYWYTYDNEGHRTEKYQWLDLDENGAVSGNEKFDRTTYTWDIRGRLIETVTRPDGTTKSKVVNYEYDYQNRRVEKNIKTYDASGEKTRTVERYLYNGQDIVLQTDGNGDITHRYLHGPAVDQCLADERVWEDNVLYPLFDNLGTIRDIADHDPTTGDTVIANHIVFSSYGVILSQTDPTKSTLYGLAGREIDPESGEYYLRGRYYDAALQQLISEDPISFWAGDPNPRRYCGNSPTNQTDPSGFEGQYGEMPSPYEQMRAHPLSARWRGDLLVPNTGIPWVDEIKADYGRLMDAPIYNPIPRSFRGSVTSLPFRPAESTYNRYLAGDPEYSSTLFEYVAGMEETVIDLVLMFGGGGSAPSPRSVPQSPRRVVPYAGPKIPTQSAYKPPASTPNVLPPSAPKPVVPSVPPPVVSSGTKNVAIVGPKGKMGEFDVVFTDIFVEEKTAITSNIQKGLRFSGKTFDQAAKDWAVKNIFEKTKVRIQNLQIATGTLAEEGGSRLVPHIDEIRGIRKLHFKVEGNDPSLVRHVTDQVSELRKAFPDWTFSVEFTP